MNSEQRNACECHFTFASRMIPLGVTPAEYVRFVQTLSPTDANRLSAPRNVALAYLARRYPEALAEWGDFRSMVCAFIIWIAFWRSARWFRRRPGGKRQPVFYPPAPVPPADIVDPSVNRASSDMMAMSFASQSELVSPGLLIWEAYSKDGLDNVFSFDTVSDPAIRADIDNIVNEASAAETNAIM